MVSVSYNEIEKKKALQQLGNNAEITRFKGLGEISSHEFGQFIHDDGHLHPVPWDASVDFLSFYMGKNTSERQHFVIHNLRDHR